MHMSRQVFKKGWVFASFHLYHFRITMKYLALTASLFIIHISAAIAATCSLEQSNACVMFVAPGGNLCTNTSCQEENLGACSTTVQEKCDQFLLAGGVNCAYIPDDPYFTCQA